MAGTRGFGLGKFIAVALLGMCVLAVSVVAGVDYAIDRAVSADARARAEGWARYFVSAMPNFDALMRDGRLDASQSEVIEAASKVGNVFRFKLYDSAGNAILESDTEHFDDDEDGADHVEDEAIEVVETKKPIVSLNDGTHERNMPPLYAEAYVPVIGAGGALTAIAEAYVDETDTARFFRLSFQTLAIALGVGMALAFGIPTFAFLVRSKQARDVRLRAEFLATHDGLTSLLNRARFTELLALRMQNPPAGQTLALALLDIDDFKGINDRYGHEAGDELLKHVARILAGLAAEGDFVGRAGADEFVLALARPDEASLVASLNAMLQAAREPLAARGHSIVGALSAGLYLIEGARETTAAALHRAEIALRQSKIGGRSTVCVYSEALEARMRARGELEQLVQEGLEAGLFELHYQPLLDATSKATIGFEALLRLHDRQGGFVPPERFIPMAESIGRIGQIGQWVIEEATRTAALWPQGMFVSVNLSVRQFADGDLVPIVARALERSGLEPGRLELEVTESLLMENTQSVARQIADLKAMGVSIAMDDFGTGYSSLGYLWQFGFDKLKIDRSFVAALEIDEPKAREILDTIVTLAHKLDMRVTAEGIETERQAAILRALACDQFQGFLFGRPGPATDIAARLAKEITPPGEKPDGVRVGRG